MKIICFLKKKEGMSDAAFRAYYEGNHAPLINSLLPFFSDYRRNYLVPDESYAPAHVENNDARPAFDVITEISFANRADYDRMNAAIADPAIGDRIARDEENLFDRSAMAMYVVDEVQGGSNRPVATESAV